MLFWRFHNTYTFEFGIGVLLFHFREKIQHYWTRRTVIYKTIVCCMAVLFYSCLFKFGSLFSSENIAFSYSKDRLLVNIGCMLFFMIIISSEKIQSILVNKWLIGIGKVCYSFYLSHMLWLILFTAKIYMCAMQIFENSFFAIGIVFCLYILSTILLSFFSFNFIELPFNKLGKRISYKFKQSSLPEAGKNILKRSIN